MRPPDASNMYAQNGYSGPAAAGPIEAYEFGRITIARRIYTSDVLIFPDGTVKGDWWRSEGHRLVTEDITELLKHAPEHIVVGTGAYGAMHIDPRLKRHLSEKGVHLIAAPTARAVLIFNSKFGKGKVAGAFHLTC